ncbi:MAG: AAA-associated domain-containing protein [Candidatus Micrarchaeota archaeon]|nr:AAA-associated domain-containing protein [Candidatus Micrarchaeota archaeon]
MKLFPLDTSVSQIRGIIEIMKDSNGSIDVSKLAEETNDEIDDLFPLIDTCVLLKLCTVKSGAVKLTKTGMNLATHNTREVFARALHNVEPFKSAISAIKKGKRMTTPEVSKALYKKGILYNSDEITNTELLKNLLLKWGISNKLFSYDYELDVWSMG